MDKGVYIHSLKEAREWDEEELWRESHKLNCDCARAIENSIKEHFDGKTLCDDGAEEIVEKYGYGRVKWVLANTLKEKYGDGRFSQQNRCWLMRQRIPQHEYNWMFSVESHPAVVDGFITQVKRMWDAIGLFDSSHCVPESAKNMDYEGKVLVFDAERMKDEHLHPEEQLFFAQSGFGCRPQARGTKVFGIFLWDDEDCHITRQSAIGVIRDECLPEWAKQKLEQLQKSTLDEGEAMVQ